MGLVVVAAHLELSSELRRELLQFLDDHETEELIESVDPEDVDAGLEEVPSLYPDQFNSAR